MSCPVCQSTTLKLCGVLRYRCTECKSELVGGRNTADLIWRFCTQLGSTDDDVLTRHIELPALASARARFMCNLVSANAVTELLESERVREVRQSTIEFAVGHTFVKLVIDGREFTYTLD